MRGGRGPPSNRPGSNKPAAPPQDPPPSPPPARVPLHVVSADTTFPDTTPPITPADIPALFLAATSVLRLINAGTSDGRRFSAAPQAKDRAAWRLVQTAVPSLTDKAAQEVISSWLRDQGSRDPLLSRSYRSPELSRVVRDTPRRACGSFLIHFRTLPHLTRHPHRILQLHAIPARMSSSPLPLMFPWPARLLEIRSLSNLVQVRRSHPSWGTDQGTPDGVQKRV